MLSRVDNVPVTPVTEEFEYDSLDRLIEVSNAYSRTFGYDTIGNLTDNNGVTQTYGNNAGPHAITYDGTNSYTYDANGNMNVGTARSWDVENRLTSVTKNSVTETYVYDGDGNRVKKVVQGGDTTVYVNQYYEKNITTGDVTTYYYLGGKLVAKMVDDGEDTTLTFIHQDSLNSTSLVTTDAGTQESISTYYPFGGTRTGSVSTDQKFTGQRLDDTGLYYYNARYYDATIGRFISADTVVQNPANPQTLNRYSYCLNNPLKYTDPSGHVVNIEDERTAFWLQYGYIDPYDFEIMRENYENLTEAWEIYCEVAPELTNYLIDSDEIITIKSDRTMRNTEYGSWFSPTRTMKINPYLASSNFDPLKMVVVIAHESLHAVISLQNPIALPSTGDEMLAWSYGYWTGVLLGYVDKDSSPFNTVNPHVNTVILWSSFSMLEGELRKLHYDLPSSSKSQAASLQVTVITYWPSIPIPSQTRGGIQYE